MLDKILREFALLILGIMIGSFICLGIAQKDRKALDECMKVVEDFK